MLQLCRTAPLAGSGAEISRAQSSIYPQQIQVQHPAAKSMIEISRTQDEEVGDGTTSVIILGKGGRCA